MDDFTQDPKSKTKLQKPLKDVISKLLTCFIFARWDLNSYLELYYNCTFTIKINMEYKGIIINAILLNFKVLTRF